VIIELNKNEEYIHKKDCCKRSGYVHRGKVSNDLFKLEF